VILLTNVQTVYAFINITNITSELSEARWPWPLTSPTHNGKHLLWGTCVPNLNFCYFFFAILSQWSQLARECTEGLYRRTAMLWDSGVTKKVLSGVSRTCNATGLAPGVVIMEIDDCTAGTSWSVASSLLAGVNERLGERDAVSDVIRAAGPLEAVSDQPPAVVAAGPASLLHRRRWTGRDGAVAAAAIQLTRAARSCDGVDDAGRRDGVHERSFPCS